MATEIRKPSPEAGNEGQSSQPETDRRQNTPQEGEYRNVETGADSREDFGDDYEAEQENEIGREEAKTEKEGRTGKS